MPAAAASRIETDIAELIVPNVADLNLPDTTPVLPGQPTDADEPPEPLKNGEPRRWAEFCVAATTVIFVGLTMASWALKKGQVWYTAVHSLLLASAMVLIACLFWGNTHIKMIRFLSRKPIFVQVVVLALIDWLQVIIMPTPGWEMTDPVAATTTLTFRLGFICLDSLKGISRWFRLFSAFFFMFGNFVSVFFAYFWNPALALYTISATNTTITNSSVQASVGTTIVTLTAAMLVTIWQDKDFQYSALFRSYLPKLAVETAGAEPGSAEMDRILEARDSSAVAWKGWPRKSAIVVLVSIAVLFLSIVLSATALEYDVDGRESTAMLALRWTALTLLCGASCAFFFNNVNWRRLKYTFSSTEGLLWMFYIFIYAIAGLSRPKGTASVSSALGAVYATLGFTLWLLLESVQQINRHMHMAMTLITALTLVITIYLTAYVWKDDVVLADLNGVGVPGTLTQFAAQRTCLINLLVLMAGALSVSLTKSLPDGSYFVLLTGNVMRRQILEAESLNDYPDGDDDLIVENSLENRVSRHSSC